MSENIIQYVAAAGNGDTDAMAKLYSKTLKASYFLASILCSDAQEAVDITKKAYARAFCTIDKLKKPEAFEIWMKQNVAAVYKEGRKFVFTDADAGAQENAQEFLPESVLNDAQMCSNIIDAVRGLKTELKTAVVLHYNNGMPVSVLAKFFGVSESTANALLCKARAEILAAVGVSLPEGEASESLPVLTRIFQRSAVETTIENSVVRDAFIYATDAYEAAKPAQVQPDLQEEEKSVSEESVEEAPAEEPAPEVKEEEPAPEQSNIISFKQKINEILDSENIPPYAETYNENEAPVSRDFDDDGQEESPEIPEINSTESAGEAALESFGGISSIDDIKDEEPAPEVKEEPKKFKLNLNPKTIGIICAAVAVLIIICFAVGKLAGGDKPSKTPDSSGGVSAGVDAMAAGYKWQAGGFDECRDIIYLDENCCYFKSATTGKYGLLDYQGNVILQPNYDGFSRCGSGRDYSSRGSYHSLVQIGNDYFEFTIAGGTVTISDTPHSSHSVEGDSLTDTAYDERDRYFEGYAAARKDGKWGYVSQDKDKKVIPYEYEPVNELQNYEAAACDYCRGVTGGLIAVKKGGMMGIIDLENEVVVPFEYSNIMPGSNGVFIACKDGIWGVILVGDAVASFTGVNITVETLPSGVTTNPSETLDRYTVKSDDGANVRSDAGAEYDLLGELDFGDTFEAYATKEAENGKTWVCMKYNGEYGWVALSNLEKEGA